VHYRHSHSRSARGVVSHCIGQKRIGFRANVNRKDPCGVLAFIEQMMTQAWEGTLKPELQLIFVMTNIFLTFALKKL